MPAGCRSIDVSSTPPTACPRATAGRPWTSRPRATADRGPTPAPGGHRAGRGRHRARHAEDRQGSRRLPGPPRHPRNGPVLPACGQAIPVLGSPDVPPRQRLPGGTPDPGSPSTGLTSRSTFGRQAIAGQWAAAEFTALARLCAAGGPVPYPVQILGTELLLEFIGSADGTAAPRLAETRPGPAELTGLWGRDGAGAGRPGPARTGPRRPVAVQPAGARRPAGADRPATGGGRGRQPAGRPATWSATPTTSRPGSPPAA